MSSIEEILKRDGILVYGTRGRSMEPPAAAGQGLGDDSSPSRSFNKKYDVAHCKCGGAYILHGAFDVGPDHYLIRDCPLCALYVSLRSLAAHLAKRLGLRPLIHKLRGKSRLI